MAPSLTSSGNVLADRRYAYAIAAAKDGDHAAAADLLEQTLEMVPGWPPALLALGDSRLSLGDRAGAVAAWRETLARQPDDVLGAKPRLARLGQLPTETALGDSYIRALFDDYADRFDTHLRGALAYSGPETIIAALDTVAPKRAFSRVLDLGCGTGLMGEAIRARAAWLGGCDLSASMIAKAESKTLYDELAVANLCAYLEGNSADLILAADVLVYMGDLTPVFAAVARALMHNGLFIFTVQKSDEALRLGEDLRYAHSETLLQEIAAATGLDWHGAEPCATRLDRGVPVPGLVVTLRQA